MLISILNNLLLEGMSLLPVFVVGRSEFRTLSTTSEPYLNHQ